MIRKTHMGFFAKMQAKSICRVLFCRRRVYIYKYVIYLGILLRMFL